MKLLIDGDIFVFRCAAAAENEDVGIAKYYIDQLLDNVVEALKATEFQFFLTGENNFRYQVYPEYKANRIGQPVPRHKQALKEYLINKYNATVSEGCEADDLIGIAQCSETARNRTCIVSLDKDLLMIPGEHYSWEISGGTGEKRWTKGAVHQDIDPTQALRWFYTQLLIGDTTDNIKGCPGIGPVKAAKILNGLETEEELFEAVRNAYSFDEALLMNGQCLWIWRKENDIWKLPYS